jgi:hypothetical protein
MSTSGSSRSPPKATTTYVMSKSSMTEATVS